MGITQKNWEKFYYDRNSEGLGSLYERLILHNYLNKILSKYSINNVLECPSFGMTGYSGINSWLFAKRGLEVTVTDDDPKRLWFIRKIWRMARLNADFVKVDDYENLPFQDSSFDLVWNFCALWYLKNYKIEKVIDELARVTKKVLFIIIPNKNIFFSLRKKIDPEFFRYVNIEIINYILKKDELKYGFKLMKTVYFDTPPWPDFAMSIKDLMSILFGIKVNENRSKKIVLPKYYDCLEDTVLREKVLRYSFLESFPRVFKKIWSHHIGLIYVCDA